MKVKKLTKNLFKCYFWKIYIKAKNKSKFFMYFKKNKYEKVTTVSEFEQYLKKILI